MIKIGKLLAAVVLFGSVAGATDYAKEMRKAFEKAFKGDYSKYQFFGTPVSNFGVGTMYPQEAQAGNFDITTSGLYGDPRTWWVKDYAKDDDPELVSLSKKLFPPGENGGPLAFNLDTSKTFDLGAVLPGLFKILSLSGNVKWSKKIKVQLTADQMINRRINWPELDDDRKLIKPSVSRHFDAHDFIITTGDVVLTKYKALLVVDKNLSADAKAQLVAAWSQFSKDSKLDANFSSAETGTFAISSDKPVVIAVFVGKPPAGALRSNDAKQVKSVPLGSNVVNTIANQPSSITVK